MSTDAPHPHEPGVSAPASLLEFEPVLVRRRKDGWTPERQRRYVAALAEYGKCRAAALAVGMSEQGACRLRRRPGAESFSRACEQAWMFAARRQARLKIAPLFSESGAGRPAGRSGPPSEPVRRGQAALTAYASGIPAPGGSNLENVMNLPPSRLEIATLSPGVGAGRPTGGFADRIDAAKPPR